MTDTQCKTCNANAGIHGHNLTIPSFQSVVHTQHQGIHVIKKGS